MKRLFFYVLFGILLMNSCNKKPELDVREYWMRSGLKNGNSAMYMTLQNNSESGEELIGASSTIAQAVEIHESKPGDNGMMQMIPQGSIAIASGETLEFKPGGLHIMFIGLNQDIGEGKIVEVVLHFKNHGDLILKVPARDAQDVGGTSMDSQKMP
jgi:hypothetical protein